MRDLIEFVDIVLRCVNSKIFYFYIEFFLEY